MFRKIGFVILITALAVSACGRQVTPDRVNGSAAGLSPGFMSFKFRVGAPFDFQDYQYAMVFDTAGATGDTSQAGVTPLPLGQNTNYAGYSFAIVVTNIGGQVEPQLVQYIRNLGNTGTTAVVANTCPTLPQQLQLLQNTNGAGTEFTVIFQRAIFNGCYNPTPAPGSTATPTTAPTATPTASPSSSASPTSSPAATPTPNYAPIWSFNAFALQQTSQSQFNLSTEVIVDSLGTNGPTDTSFSSPALDTTQVLDVPVTTLGVGGGGHPPATQPDAITSVEIFNNP
jgi:hypothetical protein